MSLSNSMILKAALSISLCIVISIVACNSKSELEPGLKQLAIDFKAANRADTIKPMLKLYCLDGSDELSITRLKGALQYELGIPIEKIEFEPLSGAPEETIQFIHDGVEYGPTLKPRSKMRVTYKSKDRFTSLFTVGKDNAGNWRFISAKPVPTPRM